MNPVISGSFRNLLISGSKNSINIKNPTTDKVKKTLIIAGASAEIARPAIIEAVKRDYTVIGLTTSKNSNPKDIPPEVFRYLEIKESSYRDPDEMTNLISREIESDQADQLFGLVLIGGAKAPKGRTLEDLNFSPLRTVSKAITNISKGSMKTGMVYLSSIAAPLLAPLGDEYAISRQKADDWLMNKSKHDVAHSFQPGLIFDDPRKTKSLISKHPYSIDQLVNTPLVTPLIGSGNQICESVVVCDLIEAIFNSFERANGSRDVIPAVTRHQYTQIEIVKLYGTAMGKKIRPFMVPAGMARIVAKHFSHGRLAPYSAHLFEMRDNPGAKHFCHNKFESFLNRDSVSLEEILTPDDNEVFLSSESPIFNHAKEILKTSLNNPEARAAIYEIIMKYGIEITRQFLKSLFRD